MSWLLWATPGMAHHSFSAVFDVARPVELTGAITRIEWTNPHAWIHIEVEGAEGNVENWSVELLGINTLLKQGWTPETAQPGDVISVVGFGARDGSTSANASSVVMVETGEQLWASESRQD
ncbi:MAG: DUF6152 family protein [Rhodospirillaceae bacterium]|nr:DUF6152 family protein [Rhodospirillaceae bacterium]